VCAILDAHYLNRDVELAWSAIRKLEMSVAKRRSGFPTALPTALSESNDILENAL